MGSTHIPEVSHVVPFTSKDLGVRSLPDRLSDIKELLLIHPNKPKEAAFNKFKVYLDDGAAIATRGRCYVYCTMSCQLELKNR